MLPIWFKLSVEGSSASLQLDPEPKPADTVLSKDVKISDPSNLSFIGMHSAPRQWANISWGLCVA